MPATTITFQFQDGQPAQTHVAATGESVLDVALNNGIQLQHNCGGVCGCSTCHLYVDQGGDDLPEISEKEEDFIDRAINPRISSPPRLPVRGRGQYATHRHRATPTFSGTLVF